MKKSELTNPIDELIVRAGTTRTALARKLGVEPQAVAKWTKGGGIDRSRLAGLCRELRCSADEVFGIREVGSPPLRFDVRTLEDAIDVVEQVLEGHRNVTPQRRAKYITLAYEALVEGAAPAIVLHLIKGSLS